MPNRPNFYIANPARPPSQHGCARGDNERRGGDHARERGEEGFGLRKLLFVLCVSLPPKANAVGQLAHVRLPRRDHAEQGLLQGESRPRRRRGLGHPLALGGQGGREEGVRLRIHVHGRPRRGFGQGQRPGGRRRSAQVRRRGAGPRAGLCRHHHLRVDGLLPASRVDVGQRHLRARQVPEAGRRAVPVARDHVLGPRGPARRARRKGQGHGRGHGGLGRLCGRDDARARRRRAVLARRLRRRADVVLPEAGAVGRAQGGGGALRAGSRLRFRFEHGDAGAVARLHGQVRLCRALWRGLRVRRLVHRRLPRLAHREDLDARVPLDGARGRLHALGPAGVLRGSRRRRFGHEAHHGVHHHAKTARAVPPLLHRRRGRAARRRRRQRRAELGALLATFVAIARRGPPQSAAMPLLTF